MRYCFSCSSVLVLDGEVRDFSQQIPHSYELFRLEGMSARTSRDFDVSCKSDSSSFSMCVWLTKLVSSKRAFSFWIRISVIYFINFYIAISDDHKIAIFDNMFFIFGKSLFMRLASRSFDENGQCRQVKEKYTCVAVYIKYSKIHYRVLLLGMLHITRCGTKMKSVHRNFCCTLCFELNDLFSYLFPV